MNQNVSTKKVVSMVAAIFSMVAIMEYFIPFAKVWFFETVELSVYQMFNNGTGKVVACVGTVILLANAIVQFLKPKAWMSLVSAVFTSMPIVFVMDEKFLHSVDKGPGFYLAVFSTIVLTVCWLIEYILYLPTIKNPGRMAIIGAVFTAIGIVLPFIAPVLTLLAVPVALPIGLALLFTAFMGFLFSKRKKENSLSTASGDTETVTADGGETEISSPQDSNCSDNCSDNGETGSYGDSDGPWYSTSKGKAIIGAAAVIVVAVICWLLMSGSKKGPFVGTWQLHNEVKADEGFVEAVYDYTLRLDFYASTVNYGDTARVLGLICSHEDAGGNDITAEEVITEADIDGNTARIKYRHQETGELWSATLVYNPEDKSVMFINGEMLEKGPYSSADDSPQYDSDFEGRVFYIEPDKETLPFVSDDPNHVFSPEGDAQSDTPDADGDTAGAEETPQEDDGSNDDGIALADRTIYMDYVEGKGNVLMCRFKASGEVTKIYEAGEDEPAPLGIENAWLTADGKGVLVVTWDGGTDFTYMHLIKIDANNKAELIDSSEGVNPNSISIGPENITDDMVPSITRESDRIKVRLAGEQSDETHYYDMNGNPV